MYHIYTLPILCTLVRYVSDRLILHVGQLHNVCNASNTLPHSRNASEVNQRPQSYVRPETTQSRQNSTAADCQFSWSNGYVTFLGLCSVVSANHSLSACLSSKHVAAIGGREPTTRILRTLSHLESYGDLQYFVAHLRRGGRRLVWRMGSLATRFK